MSEKIDNIRKFLVGGILDWEAYRLHHGPIILADLGGDLVNNGGKTRKPAKFTQSAYEGRYRTPSRHPEGHY